MINETDSTDCFKYKNKLRYVVNYNNFNHNEADCFNQL